MEIKKEYYTAEEVYYELNDKIGMKSNGLKFEDFVIKHNIYINIKQESDDTHLMKLLNNVPMKRNSDNPFITKYGVYNGLSVYSLADATITDFSTANDEIELKYYYGNIDTKEKGVSVSNENVFIPLDKLTCNRHFVLVFCIKNNKVMLYNIYCTVLKDNGEPIGYINTNYFKEIKFIIAHNEGFLYYNYTDDLTNNFNKLNGDLFLIKTDDYPKMWYDDLYIVDNRCIKYKQDTMIMNGKIKPIVYIPSDKFKECFIQKEESYHRVYRSMISHIEPLDFDKDIDYFNDYNNYCIRKGIKTKNDNKDIDDEFSNDV